MSSNGNGHGIQEERVIIEFDSARDDLMFGAVVGGDGEEPNRLYLTPMGPGDDGQMVTIEFRAPPLELLRMCHYLLGVVLVEPPDDLEDGNVNDLAADSD